MLEIRGMAIMAAKAALGNEAGELLAACGLEALRSDGWYPQQSYLQLLERIGNTDFGALLNVTAIGLRSVELYHMIYIEQTQAQNQPYRADPDVTSAIHSLNAGWTAAHRGGVPGAFRMVDSTPEHVTVEVETSFPLEYSYGLLYGLARLYRPINTRFMVDYDDPVKSGCYLFHLWFEDATM